MCAGTYCVNMLCWRSIFGLPGDLWLDSGSRFLNDDVVLIPKDPGTDSLAGLTHGEKRHGASLLLLLAFCSPRAWSSAVPEALPFPGARCHWWAACHWQGRVAPGSGSMARLHVLSRCKKLLVWAEGDREGTKWIWTAMPNFWLFSCLNFA